MPYPFTNALYYPNIDINNTEWLRTAVLFWDSISTIVPEEIHNPYRNRDTKYLYEQGILKPIIVNSDDEAVIGIEDDIFNVLSSPEITQQLFCDNNTFSTRIFKSKMSMVLRELIEENQFYREIIRNIHNSVSNSYSVNDTFAFFYMSVLANKLSERHALEMISNKLFIHNVGNSIKFDNGSRMHNPDSGIFQRPIHAREMAQGCLLNLIIEGLSVSGDASLDDIVRFKRDHQNELRAFKIAISELVHEYDDTSVPIAEIQNNVKNIYENNFLHAYNELKRSLKDFRIRWVANTIFTVSAVFAAEGIPLLLMGMPQEQALLAQGGVSLLTSGVKYNIKKRELLRNNPYSYLLSIERNL